MKVFAFLALAFIIPIHLASRQKKDLICNLFPKRLRSQAIVVKECNVNGAIKLGSTHRCDHAIVSETASLVVWLSFRLNANSSKILFR